MKQEIVNKLFGKKHSIVSKTLRLAILRIGLVSICGGLISYYINQSTFEELVRVQLARSTEQSIQRESLPFKEAKDIERNFLQEFRDTYNSSSSRQKLVRDFDLLYYRHRDGSYTQRPGLFEGKALKDGRRFPEVSATYSPEFKLTEDVKARMALSYILSYKFGSSEKGRLFNFYGVLPEKGFPVYQAADISKVYTYEGPNALNMRTYEFYSRGFGFSGNDTFFTHMYWDPSNKAWMTTIVTPDKADATGKHRIIACTDVLLNDLMQRVVKPVIQGTYNSVFLEDKEGTLICYGAYNDEIKKSNGDATIKSLGIKNDYPLLKEVSKLVANKIILVNTKKDIVAMGRIPETPWILAVHYPHSLMRPMVLQNLAIVIILGLITLLIEIFVIRSVLQKEVAIPLEKLIRATKLVGLSGEQLDYSILPTQSKDEISELAKDFATMANRIQEAQEGLEAKIKERTLALNEANCVLLELSTTDGLTGIANRRRFDAALKEEWKRAQRMENYLMLAILDVDWFKEYNDHYGHQAGDECLQKIAQLIEAQSHRAGDLVARYGGEEFAMIITTTDHGSALVFAQQICKIIENEEIPHPLSPLGHLTISIGVAGSIPREGEEPEALLKKADKALYRAKNQGRNQACID